MHFGRVFTSALVEFDKPNPEFFRHVVLALNAKPTRILGIRRGIEAALHLVGSNAVSCLTLVPLGARSRLVPTSC